MAQCLAQSRSSINGIVVFVVVAVFQHEAEVVTVGQLASGRKANSDVNASQGTRKGTAAKHQGRRQWAKGVGYDSPNHLHFIGEDLRLFQENADPPIRGLRVLLLTWSPATGSVSGTPVGTTMQLAASQS